ncbi:thermonuclease family protein [Maritalea porphyrae]|nr:thermonuclease family protein [Maritalea porphyrae]
MALLFGGALIWMVVVADQKNTREVRGLARVIDGDSLQIEGQKIRVIGIDAPELDQPCRVNGKEWLCGLDAKNSLTAQINGRLVDCASQGKDKYRRLLAVCKVDGKDIGKWMVTNGWAVSFGDYAFDEAIARNNRLGIWQGEFERPKDWRRKSDTDRSGVSAFGWILEWLGL